MKNLHMFFSVLVGGGGGLDDFVSQSIFKGTCLVSWESVIFSPTFLVLSKKTICNNYLFSSW